MYNGEINRMVTTKFGLYWVETIKKKYITDFFLKEKSKLADPLEKLIDSLTTDSSSSLDALTVGPAWSGTNLKGKVSG